VSTYVALLHSIILDRNRRLNMAEWRAMMERLGLEAPRTLIATGNGVFEARGTTASALEARLEAAFEQSFGRHVDTIVRSAARWRKTIAANPYPRESEQDGSRVIVRIMRRALDESTVAALRPSLATKDRLAVVDGDLWIYFRGQPSQSKLASALTTQRLGIGTLRNWNTVRRLADML
jgi:uncharacterized protein (DUF1697 family)